MNDQIYAIFHLVFSGLYIVYLVFPCLNCRCASCHVFPLDSGCMLMVTLQSASAQSICSSLPYSVGSQFMSAFPNISP